MLGSFGPREYDALVVANIMNASHLNCILEQMRVPYSTRPLPGSETSQAAKKKQKAKVSRKPAAKKAKLSSS
jgi:hypothetical protein